MKQFKCFSLKLAGFLMQKGFVLLDIKDDNKSSRKIYIFNDSQPLMQAVLEYKINNI